ncbi:MAG: gamma-butyrobetaine hydroxylase-like domain-containing protein [Phycisphaerales bacterium]
MSHPPPRKLDVKKDTGLTIEWPDGATSFYSVNYLRRFSPSADARQLREDLARNPLTVLPPSALGSGPLRIVDAGLVGNYALRIEFSDGHSTGIYSWDYLREIDPAIPGNEKGPQGSPFKRDFPSGVVVDGKAQGG